MRKRLTGKTSLKSQAYPLSIEHLVKHKSSLGSVAISMNGGLSREQTSNGL
jgi:hypothetical protein